MKTLILTLTAAAFAATLGASAGAAPLAYGVYSIDKMAAASTVDKRRKPRIKGGSGCDDAGDVLEHPECR